MTRDHSIPNADKLAQLNVRLPETTIARAHRLRQLGAGKPETMSGFFARLIDEAWESSQPQLRSSTMEVLDLRRNKLVRDDRENLEYMRALADVFGPDPSWDVASQQEVLERIERLEALPIPSQQAMPTAE